MSLPASETSIVTAAEMYVALDLPPIRLYGIAPGGLCTCGDRECRAQGKHPIGDHWQKQATLDLDVVRSRFAGHRGNIGIYVGASSLVLIDADGDEGLASVATWNIPPTLQAQSGRGNGAHYLLRLAPHQDKSNISDRKVAPGIDVKARGQLVAAPSWHQSGRQYQWINMMPIALMPDDIYERIKRPVHVVHPRPAPLSSSNLLVRARAYIDKMPPAISGSRGHDATYAVARKLVKDFALDEVDAWNILVDYNKRCEPPWSEKELQHKLASAFDARVVNPISERPLPQRAPRPEPDPFSEPDPEPAQVRIAEPDWQSLLLYNHTKTGKAKLVSHCENVVRILTLDPRWAGKLRYDAFRGRTLAQDPPWDEYSSAAYAELQWTDEDDTRLTNWMRRQFHGDAFAPALADCAKAVEVVAQRNGFHPVKDYLDALAWDNTLRLERWLPNYLGTEDSEYARKVGLYWLVSAVARIYAPGCKADHVLILEGKQGIGKSTALSILGGDWFNDTPIDLNSKDAYSAIRGQWIVELAELDSLFRSETSRAKAFFSSPKDTYRAAYARREREQPRQCVFAGSVNEKSYLKDHTGARRFWPVECKHVYRARLAADRDQLWAEAVWRYKNGSQWWLDDADAEIAREQQSERTRGDEWAAPIAAYLIGKSEATTADLLEFALRIEKRDWTTAAQMRVGVIMQYDLGWERKRRRRPPQGVTAVGVPTWVYCRPE